MENGHATVVFDLPVNDGAAAWATAAEAILGPCPRFYGPVAVELSIGHPDDAKDWGVSDPLGSCINRLEVVGIISHRRQVASASARWDEALAPGRLRLVIGGKKAEDITPAEKVA
jgi:hypothetical protein